MSRVIKGIEPLNADASDLAAYEAERQALIADLEREHGPGKFTATVSDDFVFMEWTYRIR